MLKKARKSEAEEAAKLSDLESGVDGKINLFKSEHVGLFGSIWRTDEYMRIRRTITITLMKLNTYAAITQAYDMAVRSLFLDRSDQLGMRHIIPFLCLRLGKNQPAYDFCTWYKYVNSEVSLSLLINGSILCCRDQSARKSYCNAFYK